MKRKEVAIVCVSVLGIEGILAKVLDLESQVITTFVNRDDDHITLHTQEGTSHLLVTYYSREKPLSKADPQKVEIAKQLGFKNAERHAQYIMHQELAPEGLKADYIIPGSGQPKTVKRLAPFIIIGMTSNDCRCPIPEKYAEIPKVSFSVDTSEFFLSVYFTRDDAEFRGVDLVSIETSLGFLSFGVEKDPNAKLGIESWFVGSC